MKARRWRSDPPSHVGWWNASADRHADAWRWWDGYHWSLVAYPEQSAKLAAARTALHHHARIEWTDYYPKNARVPRLDPTDGHWTFNQGVRPRITCNRIDLVFRDGHISRNESWGGYQWQLDGAPFNIIAWRPAA